MPRPDKQKSVAAMTSRARREAWLFPSLRGYTLAMLPTDALAALVLTAIALPGQLATAKLMHLSPMAGLLAFAAGSFAFAALGSNRFASVAADSTIAVDLLQSLEATGRTHLHHSHSSVLDFLFMSWLQSGDESAGAPARPPRAAGRP